MKLEKIIGDNVRGFRKQTGLSQDNFAIKAGLHRTFIGTIERAEQNITIDSIGKLAKALGVLPYVLLLQDAWLQAKKYQKLG
jgi:transcriptional regulator with XRE-family HTH domain